MTCRRCGSPGSGFRATFGRRWGGLLAIVLLIGLVGGLSMGAIAGARRTQSPYPAFLRSTNPSDLLVPTAVYGLTSPTTGYDPVILRKIARLPHVEHVEASASVNDALLLADGTEFTPPKSAPANFEVGTVGSVDGLYVDQDRIAITEGRMVDPARANEMLLSAPLAELLGYPRRCGPPLRLLHQRARGRARTERRASTDRIPISGSRSQVVGIGEYNNAVVQDDVDALGSNFTLFTPALTRRLTACCTQTTTAGLQLDHGGRDVPAVEAELQQLNPLLGSHVYVSSVDAAKVERAIEPESIALARVRLHRRARQRS